MDYIKELRKKVGHAPLLIPHSVVILINDNDEILMEVRKDDGFYDFPGGGIDINERAEDAAKRELKEETGLNAKDLEFFKLYSGEITHYIYTSGDEIYGIDAVFISRNYDGELKPQKEEVKELLFLKIDDIPDKLSIRNKQILKDLKESKIL